MNPKDGAAAVKTAHADANRGRPQAAHPPAQVPNGRVTGGYVCKQLVADGLLSAADARLYAAKAGGRNQVRAG